MGHLELSSFPKEGGGPKVQRASVKTSRQFSFWFNLRTDHSGVALTANAWDQSLSHAVDFPKGQHVSASGPLVAHHLFAAMVQQFVVCN